MQLPGPVRAYVGLVATAADQAKRLPDRAIEFPMLAVSTALQMSLRAQQRYARLTVRGDEVLHRRQPTDDPPPWATFDEPVADAPIVSERVNGADPEEPTDPKPGKTINAPRHTPPSPFDTVGDETSASADTLHAADTADTVGDD